MILSKKLVFLIHLLDNIFRIASPIQLNRPKVYVIRDIKEGKYILDKNTHVTEDLQLLEFEYFDSNYEAPSMPRGFVYQIIIFSTWGDSYYVGLNGIQMYDNYGNEIELTADSMLSLYAGSDIHCQY